MNTRLRPHGMVYTVKENFMSSQMGCNKVDPGGIDPGLIQYKGNPYIQFNAPCLWNEETKKWQECKMTPIPQHAQGIKRSLNNNGDDKPSNTENKLNNRLKGKKASSRKPMPTQLKRARSVSQNTEEAKKDGGF